MISSKFIIENLKNNFIKRNLFMIRVTIWNEFRHEKHDQTGTGARLEIARDAPPQFEQLSQEMNNIL